MSDVIPDRQDQSVETLEPEATERQSFLTNAIVVLIKVPLFILVVAVYFVFGGLIWVALIARVSLIFAIGMVNAALHQRTPRNLAKSMDEAIRFFPGGFGIIYRSFFRPRDAEGMADHLGIGRMLLELLWCLAFWAGLLFVAREIYGHGTAIEVKIIKILQAIFSILKQ